MQAGINLTEEPPTPLGDQLSLNIAGGEVSILLLFAPIFSSINNRSPIHCRVSFFAHHELLVLKFPCVC